LQVIVDTNGAVHDVRLVSGPPILARRLLVRWNIGDTGLPI